MKGSFPLGHRFLLLTVALLLTILVLVFINRPTDIESVREHDYVGLSGESYREYTENWDNLYDTPQYVYGKEPSKFLSEMISKIPQGRALDIAMGEGRNSVFLAKKGFQVEGVDISSKALAKAQRLAHENQVTIETIEASLRTYVIEPEKYDLIVNINFLMRELIPKIKKGLKRGGLVVFENLVNEEAGENDPKLVPNNQLLSKGELKTSFEDFEILIYRESSTEEKGTKAYLLARKP